ncbi:MAG TPA: hypothetical protein VK524_27250 [Polyangiaceae bacterium]|nr:hypothetical protein [Polyangiaceae bacterium]
MKFTALGLSILCFACNLDDNSDGTGGVKGPPGGRCPAGTTVVLSDFQSTQIALSDLEGRTLSESFISTASAQTSGVAFALSGDVGLPSTRPASGNVVLLDRYGTNVITWVATETAEVLGQLPVGTGFESNPRDYLEVDATRAFLTRWGQNAAPGKEPFDRGGDLLVIDTQERRILSALEFPMEDGLPPRASSISRVGNEYVVTLERISDDFATTGDSILAAVSPEADEIVWQQRIEGKKNCGRVEASPSGKRFVLACSGEIDEDGEAKDLGGSGILVFERAPNGLKELDRYEPQELQSQLVQSEVAFIDDDRLLYKTQTGYGGSGNNRLAVLDFESRQSQVLIEARPDDEGKGKGLTYVGLFCAPGCAQTCLIADSDRGVLQTVHADATSVALGEPIKVEDKVGLPPVQIGPR